LVVLVPPVALAVVRLPLLLLDAPLRGKDHLLAVDFPDEALLPAMTDDPLHVLELELAMWTRLAEISKDRSVLPFSNRRADRLVVRGVLPAVVVRLVTFSTLLGASVRRLIDAPPLFFCGSGANRARKLGTTNAKKHESQAEPEETFHDPLR